MGLGPAVLNGGNNVDVETGTKDMPVGEPGELILHGPTVMYS